MFGRIEPVKNGSAVCGEAPGADSGGDAVVGDLHLGNPVRSLWMRSGLARLSTLNRFR